LRTPHPAAPRGSQDRAALFYIFAPKQIVSGQATSKPGHTALASAARSLWPEMTAAFKLESRTIISGIDL
jgi:hypothetical protein